MKWTNQVGMFSHTDEVEMTKKLRKEHALMTFDAEDLVNEEEGVSRRDVQPFIYPFDEELERVGVRGIYLSNYMRWDSKTQHEKMIELYGYETAEQERTFNTYEDVHCFHSAGLHDYLKYLKHGYGKVSDHANREIRFGRMTREEGIELVKKYEARKPKDMSLFLEWLGITEEELYSYIDPFRDPNIWQKDDAGQWQLLDSVTNHVNDEGVDAVRLPRTGPSEFILTPSREPNAIEDQYILMGRGYIDKYNFQAIDDDQELIFKELDRSRQEMENKFNALPNEDPNAAEPKATSISYCKRCILPSSKPGVVIDEEGICSACRSVEKKDHIDWDQRAQELKDICDEIRGNYGNGYECLVPVSGGKDSYYQVWMMKEIQKLYPLAVCILPHLQTSEGIANLNNMVKVFNVDLLRISLKPSVFKEVRKKAFLEKGEPNWADHCSVFAGIARMSHMYQAPLTVWGEDIAVEFGGKTSEKSTNSAEDLLDNDLVKGIPIEDFFNEHVVKKNTFFYKAPDKEDMKSKNIRSIYLGYYHNWDGDENFKIAERYGFQERKMWRLAGHFVNYDNMDEKLCEINLWFKLLKFGFWSSTDELCCEIWNKRMNRDEVVKVLNEIQYEMPSEYLKDFLEFHNISDEEFWGNVSKYLNRKIWHKVDGKWRINVPLVCEMSPAVEQA